MQSQVKHTHTQRERVIKRECVVERERERERVSVSGEPGGLIGLIDR